MNNSSAEDPAQNPDGHSNPSNPQGSLAFGWPLALVILSGGLVLTLVFYWSSIASAVSLWYNRPTYSHCFLILPISGYLIWTNKDRLLRHVPRPSILGLIVLALASLVWLVARSAGVSEGEHFAVVGIIQGIVLSVLGVGLYRAMILPMTYLWLLVPTGAFAYPMLQSLALTISSAMLKISGIPVFTEGYFIEVPVRTYEVATACSGLNFILASLALTPIFGYLMYNSFRKRVVAIFVMLAVALLANGVRIFAIIALAEFTNKQVDILDDHLLYGWAFFAVVLVVMALIGMRFADSNEKSDEFRAPPGEATKPARFVWSGLAVVVMVSLLPLYRFYAIAGVSDVSGGQIAVHRLGGEVGPAQGRWKPVFANSDLEINKTLIVDGRAVNLFAAHYDYQEEGREIIGFPNDPTGGERFQKRGGYTHRIVAEGGTIPWRIESVQSRRGRRIVAYTYQVDGRFVINTLQAKLLQSKTTLLWGRRDAGVVVVSIPATGDLGESEKDLLRIISKLDVSSLFIASQAS